MKKNKNVELLKEKVAERLECEREKKQIVAIIGEDNKQWEAYDKEFAQINNRFFDGWYILAKFPTDRLKKAILLSLSLTTGILLFLLFVKGVYPEFELLESIGITLKNSDCFNARIK